MSEATYIPKHNMPYMAKCNVEQLLLKARTCRTDKEIKELLETAVYAEVTPVIHSYWKLVTLPNGTQCKVCNFCNATVHRMWQYNYCWTCGAIMDMKEVECDF